MTLRRIKILENLA